MLASWLDTIALLIVCLSFPDSHFIHLCVAKFWCRRYSKNYWTDLLHSFVHEKITLNRKCMSFRFFNSVCHFCRNREKTSSALMYPIAWATACSSFQNFAYMEFNPILYHCHVKTQFNWFVCRCCSICQGVCPRICQGSVGHLSEHLLECLLQQLSGCLSRHQDLGTSVGASVRASIRVSVKPCVGVSIDLNCILSNVQSSMFICNQLFL